MSAPTGVTTVLGVGVRRTSLPDRAVVAVAEARVIEHELRRRVPSVVVDFRVESGSAPPWLRLAAASWPGGVDAIIDFDDGPLGALPAGALLSVLARTVGDDAVEVRARMLAHLGLMPAVADDEWWVSTAGLCWRPTDLVAVAANVPCALDDVTLAGLWETQFHATAVDAAFDSVAESLPIEPHGADLRRAIERAEAAERRNDELADAALQTERIAAKRLDAMAAEIETLRRQLERARRDLASR